MALRQAIAGAKRVVIKIGSSSLTGPDGGISTERLDGLVDVIALVRERGAAVVLVSSGAIATGFPVLGLSRRPTDLAAAQAAAAVGQGQLIARYTASMARYGVTVAQVLLTADDLMRRSHYRNAASTLERLIEFGVVPVVNENDTVATAEIRFGDNDRLAALVAHLVRADALILLSDVDGLYTARPGTHGATLIDEVVTAADLSGIDIGGTGSSIGSGGMLTKVEAADIATSAGIPVVLTSAEQAAQAIAGDQVGTFFHARADKRRSTRLLWLEHASASRGSLVLDDGAVRAIVERGSSLLPAGVVSASGEFSAGDPVDLIGLDGTVVARGLVAFDSVEVPVLLGKSTHELAAEHGPAYERELVHRDDLVLVTRS